MDTCMNGKQDRAAWIHLLNKLAKPVLQSLSERQLKHVMPIEARAGRVEYTHLEAMARLLVGMAPWLEAEASDEKEEQLRRQYGLLAREAMDAGTHPESSDFMNFSEGFQPIVDAAFLAQAILRAPTELWGKLEDRVKQQVISALKQTRTRKPYFSNWLLFSAMIEAALLKMGETDWDPMRIDYALKQHEQWYLGDGVYGDGPHHRFDYYNSFVIQPMLVDVIEHVGFKYREWEQMKDRITTRAKRYAGIQERLISPEGTFPPMGRSLAYRCGAFQVLAQMALREQLPETVQPGQVRGALTAIIQKSLEAEGTFDKEGWLTIGFAGAQGDIGEGYISTGSLYLCSTAFLPLGLSEESPFWSHPFRKWTALKAWSGEAFPIDRSVN
ncbi:DUF2264 domain-containing protein [Shouchella shacheensis]|uniref:DUF2264 domain-containing protein n=1 Tax=Shouchella shacheensis TaxID=1649580 RepID=UPI00073FD628|nr:DUF2264 domain-containing protein [Shouchella shacheensis]